MIFVEKKLIAALGVVGVIVIVGVVWYFFPVQNQIPTCVEINERYINSCGPYFELKFAQCLDLEGQARLDCIAKSSFKNMINVSDCDVYSDRVFREACKGMLTGDFSSCMGDEAYANFVCLEMKEMPLQIQNRVCGGVQNTRICNLLAVDGVESCKVEVAESCV